MGLKQYLEIVKQILKNGKDKKDRTGTGTIAVAGVKFEHDMAEGFPLITTKKVPLRLVSSELEFFIKGISDKKWLQERNNHIWDEWCSPDVVAYAHDKETKKKMMKERELGPVYGWQWRNFGAEYISYDKEKKGKGVDQLKNVIDTLRKNPENRRLIVSAWNPVDIPRMALPPCHYCFQLIVINNRLNLLWNQRSVDVALGLPFNIASYGLLLHLIAKETGLREGKLIGFLGDTHIYINHIEGMKRQITRNPYKLSKIRTSDFSSIFEWNYTDTKIIDYKHHPHIKFEIAV
ncbi:thymidylate synthase [Candidatus Woesearchaeota archaeon]|nr:thymidylate synthase [Candidatus Woesearchaeota archaeon]